LNIVETKLKGAFIIALERKEDSRGFFARAFCRKEFEAHGLKPIIAHAGQYSFQLQEGHVAWNAFSVSTRS
jgi:dTDP-4-dehydrorhamnose 3,5-epimerase